MNDHKDMKHREPHSGEPVPEATRVVTVTSDGLTEKICYYCDGVEVAGEMYDRDGVLLFRSGVTPEGKVKELYRNGAVKRVIDFNDGCANGKGIEYYPGGEVFEESTFRRGVLHGVARAYRRDGLPWVDACYRDGRLHGPFTRYHDNGAVEVRTAYRNGELHGSFARYDRYGCLLEEGTFSEGQKEGDHRSYHETGHLALLERYDKGTLVSSREFDEDGVPIRTTRQRKTSREAGL